MAVLFVRLRLRSVDRVPSGMRCTTVELNVPLTEPPELFAQMVNSVRFRISVGVPQTVPLLVPNSRPAGRLGSMAHPVISPDPESVGVEGTMAVLFVRLRLRSAYASSVGT